MTMANVFLFKKEYSKIFNSSRTHTKYKRNEIVGLTTADKNSDIYINLNANTIGVACSLGKCDKDIYDKVITYISKAIAHEYVHTVIPRNIRKYKKYNVKGEERVVRLLADQN